MYHLSDSSSPPFQVTVVANGHPLLMEIDTGASVSIASLHTFETICDGESTLELQEPTVKLRTYTGEPIDVCGHVEMKITHNGQSTLLPLVVRYTRERPHIAGSELVGSPETRLE